MYCYMNKNLGSYLKYIKKYMDKFGDIQINPKQLVLIN